MSRTLYLLRHGQTRYNAELRLQGRCNSELTPRGEAQALAMGNRLSELVAEPADWTLYASPLGRARQTAERVCQQLGLDQERIIWDERLVELGMGEWEGRRVPELLAAHPELDLEEPDWYLRAPMARVLRAFSAGPGNGLRTSTLPSRPSWFLTVSLAPCCAAPMWIWTTPPPGCRSCHRMPSSNSVAVA